MNFLMITFSASVTIFRLGLLVTIALIISLFSTATFAGSTAVDKVYHPYVLPNEQEFEWRYYSPENKTTDKSTQRFAYGYSVLENVMLEGYVIAENEGENDYDVTSYEIEARWMITEQGEFWADWGMLFEVEKSARHNDWEVATGVLVEKEFGKTSLTVNLFLLYEWGETIENEFETQFRLKYRYRWIPQLQPAIELYSGDDFIGIGPAFMGIQRFNGNKQLKWEAGYIVGLDSDSSNQTFRVSIEYEF